MGLKTRRDLSAYRKVHFKPEIRECPHCGSRLRRSHTAWSKNVQTMRGKYHATSYAYKCPRTDCPEREVVYRSAEAESISLKYRTYGLDVVAEIGYLRYKDHRSQREILGQLRSRGVEISEREVYELTDVFETLIASKPMNLDVDFYEAVEENGGMVLMIDGVQPETGNSTLYLVMDALTGVVLHADFLENSATDYVAELLEHVKELDLPVIAVVSDHQSSIVLAAKKVFPKVPHQFCHFHFLRNACLPVSEMDRNLKKEIRKRIRGIKPIEVSAEKRGDEMAGEVTDWCLVLRSLLVQPRSYFFNFGGLEVYEHLKALDEAVGRCVKARADLLMERFANITCRWREFTERYEFAKELSSWTKELSRILVSPGSSRKARGRMERFLSKVEAEAPRRDGEAREALELMAKEIRLHRDGLFHFSDDPRIPRTNNPVEVKIRHFKSDHRRITGRKGWSDFVVQHGVSLFMVPEEASKEEMIDWFSDMPYQRFRHSWDEFQARRERNRKIRMAGTDFEATLEELQSRWIEA